MVRRNLIGACITTALLLTAGVTAAATDITDAITGGGNAEGGAAGHYEVDGTGAYTVTGDTAADAQGKAKEVYDQAGTALDENHPAMPTACTNADVQAPQLPLDGVNQLDVEHTDSLSKAVDADTGLVNADADVSAWGHVKGWFQGIADAVGDLFNGAQAVERPDPCKIVADAGAQLESSLTLADDVRSSLDSVAQTQLEMPELAPRVSGDYAFEHAGGLSSDVTGLIQMP